MAKRFGWLFILVALIAYAAEASYGLPLLTGLALLGLAWQRRMN